MAVSKNVSFRAPYVGQTFQRLARDLLGRDGYLEGAVALDDGVSITVGPYAFVQGGIICRQDSSSAVPVPAGAPPWFVVASAVDDDPATGVVLTATREVGEAASGVVIAFKMNGRWANPRPVSAAAMREADAQAKGRESGLRPLPGVVGGGGGNVLDSIQVSRGVAVDSRGERRDLGAVAPGMASLAPLLQGTNDRNDYILLRRRAAGAELVLAQGGAIAPAEPANVTQVDSGPLVTRPSMLAKRGGSAFQLAYAWGNGTSLMLASSIDFAVSGGAPTGVVNPFAAYTGSSQIGNVLAVALRPSDQAILVVFTEGTEVRLAAFSSATGAVVSAPVRIDTQPNACTNVSAAVGGDGFLHVVYQHNEGGTQETEQVYYTKRSVEVGTFGAAALTPRLANGVLSTKNDTWPSVGVDRRGRVHIAYATGNGSDAFGQLRYVVLDESGAALERATVAEYGQQLDPGAAVLTDATSLVANIRQPKVVVTPHDEVDIFMVMARAGAPGPDELAVYNPGLAARLGFPIVILSHVFPASGTGTDTLAALGAVSNDLGELLVFASWAKAGLLYTRIDTVLAPLGVLADSYLEQPALTATSVGNLKSDVFVTLGTSGEVLFGLVDGQNVLIAVWPSRAGGRSFTPHPDDVVLSGWKVDRADGTFLSDPAMRIPETQFEVFSVRPKKMSYPVLVGDDGDYQGYGSLLDALAVANRKGGHVVVRGGSHRPSAPLVLGSGVRLEGEGHVLLDFPIQRAPAAGLVQLGFLNVPLSCSVSGQVVTVPGAPPPPLRTVVRPGDLCELFDGGGVSTGLFRVRRVLDDAHFLVDGMPTGVEVIVYACGVELSNVSLTLEPGGQAGLVTSLIAARALYGGSIERVKLAGKLDAGATGLYAWRCRETTVRNVDVLSLTGGAGSYGIWLTDGNDNAVERALIGDADGTALRVHSSESNPRLVDCGSSRAAAPARIFLDAPRTTPAFLQGCTARIDGDVAHTVTPVGKILSSVVGKSAAAGALQLQDENTVQYGGASIDLTTPSAAGAAFNGATPHVLVPSVNERLRRAGDTMTGELGVPALLLSEWSTKPATPGVGMVRLYLQSNGLPTGQNPPQHRSQLVMLMPSGETLILGQTDPT